MNLLIGNGVNQIGSDKFTSKEILKRFLVLCTQFSYYYNGMYNVGFVKDVEKEFQKRDIDLNIELLLCEVYDFIFSSRNFLDKTKAKDILQVVTILKIIGINSIFIDNGDTIENKIPDEYVEKFNRFQNIFTLNYIENWDTLNKVQYLHGKAIINPNGKENIEYDEEQYNYDIEYASAIEDAQVELMCFPIRNVDHIVMLPIFDNIDKQDIIEIEGKHFNSGFIVYELPEPKLNKTLYSEFGNISKLVVFGVSPFGDKLLLDAIKKIKEVIIYVYEPLINAAEVNEWLRYISHAKILDSKDFLFDVN